MIMASCLLHGESRRQRVELDRLVQRGDGAGGGRAGQVKEVLGDHAALGGARGGIVDGAHDGVHDGARVLDRSCDR
jgi:hypothetical protein